MVPLQSVRDCQRPIQSLGEDVFLGRTFVQNFGVGFVAVELRATTQFGLGGRGTWNGEKSVLVDGICGWGV